MNVICDDQRQHIKYFSCLWAINCTCEFRKVHKLSLVLDSHLTDTNVSVPGSHMIRELEKIEVEGDNIYLPTAPHMLVRSIKMDSGIPLQSAAKVPIMITFNVVEKDGDPDDFKPQACIFKVIFAAISSTSHNDSDCVAISC